MSIQPIKLLSWVTIEVAIKMRKRQIFVLLIQITMQKNIFLLAYFEILHPQWNNWPEKGNNSYCTHKIIPEFWRMIMERYFSQGNRFLHSENWVMMSVLPEITNEGAQKCFHKYVSFSRQALTFFQLQSSQLQVQK